MHVRNVRSAALPDGTFEATLRTVDGASAKSSLRITGFAGSGASELFIGESPSLQSTRTKGLGYDTQTEAVKHFMPKLVVRREGTALQSNFITLMEPFAAGQQPRIEHVEVLHSDEATGAAAVAITYGSTRDIVLSAPAYAGTPLVVGELRLDGKLGFIRLVDGQIEQMRLADGTRLSMGDAVVTAGGAVEGAVTGTERQRDGDGRNTLITTAMVSPAAAGGHAIVGHPDGTTTGYRIESVEPAASGGTALVLGEQDPGFTIRPDGSSEQLYFPMKQWTGAHTVYVVHAAAGGPFVLPQPAAGTVQGTVYGSGSEPLSGASVNVSGYGSLATVTGMDGSFALTQVPGGWQRLTIRKEGYSTTVSEAVYVQAGQPASIRVEMEDTSPPVLSGAPAVGAGIGQPVQAAMSRDGTLYLVPASVAPIPAQLAAAAASPSVHAVSAAAASGLPTILPTTGFAAGRYMLYGVDGKGLVSAGSSVMLLDTGHTLIDNEDPLVRYSGTWTTTRNDDRQIGSSAATATSDGAYAEIPFYGDRAQLLGVRFNTHGKAAIYIDGVYHSSVDNYRASWKAQEIIFDTGTLPEGPHVIRYERIGEKNPASSNYFVHFDALRVMTENLLPVVDGMPSGPVSIGMPVSAKSSKNSTLYLVPHATVANRSAIEAAGATANGSSVTVTASTYGVLDTSGFAPGLYSVYAIDANGFVSEAKLPIAVIDPSAELVDSADPVVYYSGTWSTTLDDVRHIGSSAVTATSERAFALIPFYGSSAQLLGVRFHTHGKAAIYIDGVYHSTVDNYRASWKAQEIIFDTGTLAEGLHLIRYERIEEKNPASSNFYIHFDALRVIE